ncbi:MAG: fasciclin domain-containing protein, partial [Sinomicrobium sp.]|nr:fasciclin domain-containing protein [Sinomicrobium sp.]
NDDNTPSESVYDIIADNPNFETFLTAVHKLGIDADLKSNAKDYTIFVPDESGFNEFLAENGYADIDAVPTAVLEQIVRNHIVEGQVMSSASLIEESSGYLATLAEEATTMNNIDMFYYDNNGDLTLNGTSVITAPDMKASNGIVHRVDAVIAIPDILTFINRDPSLKRLSEAIGLVSADDPSFSQALMDFSAPAPYTFLAPDDNAIDSALANELGGVTLQNLQESGDLENLLDLHIITDINILSSDLTNGMVIMTQNGEITVNVEGSTVSFTDPNDRTVTVIRANIQAGNGVIHILDSVLLPL